MAKIKAYRDYFGGTFEDAYYELIDMGEIRESESTLAKCRTLDRKEG